MGNSLQLHKHREVNEAAAARNQVTLPATCEICIEPLTPDNVFNNNNQCAHPFCLDCIPKYIEAKVDDNIGNVPCPSLNCKQLLDPLFCRKFISKQLFEKWCDTLCTSMILNHEHHRRSYCPNRCCSALVINECKGNAKKVKCPNCKSYFCFKCQIPWHAGYRCEESGQLRDMNDVLFGELMERQKWCRCYKCGQCVERTRGCRSIQCRCRAISCYECGAPFHSGPCRVDGDVTTSVAPLTPCDRFCEILLVSVLLLKLIIIITLLILK